MSDQRYNLRGVSASKEDVHNAIKNIDKGIFPKAFCKTEPEQNHLWLTCTGKKPVTCQCGKVLPRMH